jgi:Putative DNA-binding domain
MGYIQQSVVRSSLDVPMRFFPYPWTNREAGGLLGPCRYEPAPSPIDVLTERFPVIHRLVGDESFRATASRFIDREPPRAATLLDFGETFPRFLRRRGKVASIEYVADIAELEMVRGKAERAAPAQPVGARALSSLLAKRGTRLRVALHPSVFLVASRFPIVTIWNNNRFDGESAMIERWRAECALVARPFLDVEVRCLPAGGHAFISALAEGHTMATAVAAGRAVTPEFDIASNLAILGEANIVVGLVADARAEQIKQDRQAIS